MSISKNCTTLELFPEIEDAGDISSDESLHLNPFEKDNMYESQGSMSICEICKTSKPERCYHCYKCNRCLLLMYKHLEWFDICIGFTNYKFYVVFLFYAMLICFIGLGCFIHALTITIPEKVYIIPTIAVATVLQCLVILVIGWELAQVIYSILKNQTIQERIHPSEDTSISYDLGALENWKMIMGEKWWEWFLPMWSTEGDGLKFRSIKKIEPAILSPGSWSTDKSLEQPKPSVQLVH
ncbi:palmitoyltransferase ZDHHC2/15/20 [Nematocida sp. AWRm80]|nr:palmitoyltransferase ZDHHC2/15/20 [Nematocida sp. AWRm80]